MSNWRPAAVPALPCCAKRTGIKGAATDRSTVANVRASAVCTCPRPHAASCKPCSARTHSKIPMPVSPTADTAPAPTAQAARQSRPPGSWRRLRAAGCSRRLTRIKHRQAAPCTSAQPPPTRRTPGSAICPATRSVPANSTPPGSGSTPPW